ncbi:arsenite methyltransferase [Bacteroidota bacterium]
MDISDKIKKVVKEKYAEIASKNSSGCGCSCSCSDDELYNIMSDDYKGKDGYVPDADLGLGCGIPTEYANIRKGNVVLDLGSGAGNDVFIVSKLVGETGKVIGLDMTEEMIDRANFNKSKLGIENVEFTFGEIENLPLQNNSVDVVVSNCVLNLVPDKNKAFSEIHRVLKNDGGFCVSDIVLEGDLPEKLLTLAELYAGCVAGASQMSSYLQIIGKNGFNDILIHKKKEIKIPVDLLNKYLSADEVEDFIKSGVGIFSITVSAKKQKV